MSPSFFVHDTQESGQKKHKWYKHLQIKVNQGTKFIVTLPVNTVKYDSFAC